MVINEGQQSGPFMRRVAMSKAAVEGKRGKAVDVAKLRPGRLDLVVYRWRDGKGKACG